MELIRYIKHLWIYLLLIDTCFAGFKTLEKKEIVSPIKQDVIKVRIASPKRKIIKNEEIDAETAETIRVLKENSEKMEAILSMKSNIPLILDESFRFQTGDVVKGILLNSVVSTNLESPLLIRVDEGQGLPEGTKFSCQGVTKFKRVVTACNLIITPGQEYQVETIVLNTDGTAGLKGIYYSGQEEYVAGAIASEFAKGILEVSQTRTSTLIGSELDNTPKNKLLQGMINSSNTVSNVLEEEMRTKEPKVFIDAGKRVLVYFTSSFKSTEQR